MDLIHEDVVISGIGGYFPKSANIEELQQHLLNNENLLETRWKYGERGVCNIVGKIPTEFFDNSYFGIHRAQCTFMDPMQRLILERTFEALIDAGVNPNEVKGKRIGVYMGSAIGENDNLFLESIVSGFGVTGHSRAMMPNRVSYWLNLKGPSVAYDSNWVGGVEVIRLAHNAIKTGQCESAIVGTANLCLNSEFQWLYTDMGLLSADGSIKAFDANASGYARSDGVVVLYMQKASAAKRFYASVLNVATRFNGNREGNLLSIDVPSMVDFMSEFYEKVPINPEQVEFVEAYGCGHKETDEKELAALEQVYCKNRKNPLLVGSIKTNTGHSEASSALFAIAKVLIAMETETIPANLQYETPNLNVAAIKNHTIEVVTENKPWKAQYAAINAIGLDSYYGHVLLKSNPKKKNLKKDDLPRLVLASTRTEEGIKSILDTVKTRAGDSEYYKLVQDLFAKPILGHLYRGYTLVGSTELKQETDYHQGNKRQIWFVYSGMGSQWCGMISDLMKLPVFANTIQKCHDILKPKGIDLMEIISTDDKTIFDNILHSFVGIAAMQIALTDVLKAVGIVPDGIIGHSVGELGCAYADNCMTAEQMILSAYSRGRASLETTLIPGMMAAIGVGYNQIKNKLPPTIEVACHNGPDSATLSGPQEDMKKFVEELQAQGTFARLVNVSNIAYHSRYIKPAAPTLLKYLKQVLPEPVKRSSKWISTSNTEENWNTELAQNSSADYHTNNLLSSVLFEEGLKHIPKDSILIEIAPHGLLQAILKRSLKSGCTNIALTQRGSKSGMEFLLQALGKMYLAGMDLTVSSIYPKVEYPVAKGTPTLANLSHWNHSESWRTGLEDKLHSLYGVRDMLVTLNSEEFRECVGHQLDEKIVLPTSYYLNIVYQIISSISSGHKEIIFENLHFKNMLTIPQIGSVPLHAMVQKGSGDFEILSNKDIIMTGRMTFPQANEKFMSENTDVPIGEENILLTGSDVYSELQHRGHTYSEPFKSIRDVTLAEEGSIGTVQADSRWTMILEAMIQQQLLQSGERNQDVQVPKTIQKITIDQNLLPAEKSDVKVTYDYSTKILATPGIQITNMNTITMDKDPVPVFYDSVEYVQLNNAQFAKIEYGIAVALQLTISNFHDEDPSNVVLTEIESKNNLLEKTKRVLAEYPMLNPNIVLVKDCKQIGIQQTHPQLLIFNDTINEDIVNLTATSHMFSLVRTSKALLNYSNVVQVAQFTVNSDSYSVIRRVDSSPVAVVYVDSPTLSVKDFKSSPSQWVKELNSLKNKNKKIYLVSSVIPIEGFDNFAEEASKIFGKNVIRLVFNIGKPSEKLKLNDLKVNQDLALHIYKDGTSYSYLPIPIKLKEDVLVKSSIDNVLKNKNMSYIGINLADETLNPATPKMNELGNIDYSGTSCGKNIMGLAVFDKDNSKLIEDDILNWEVPNHWSLEDAATIPHAYTSAYYTLFIKARLKAGDTVLVHGGCTAIGLATISIASVEGCTIFTTVATDWQKAYLKKLFPILTDRHILSSENSTFEPLLMIATGGKGANVIINTLSGSLLQCSLACIADYGRFIHIGKYDLEENNSIGMFCFLRNTSFYAVDLGNILCQNIDVKKELKQLMQAGIKKLCVRPLARKVEKHHDINSILNVLKKSNNVGKIIVKVEENLPVNKLNVKRPNQFVCQSKSSYLIHGGDIEQWADITEWLALRGARKIVICSDARPQQNHINRRLGLLQTYYGAEIIMIQNKSYSKESAAELISEVYSLGPIHIAYLLPNSSSKPNDLKYIQHIDHALRTAAPKAFLVNFVSCASGLCQSRTDAGFNSYNIQWSKELEFLDAVKCLDDIMNLTVRNILIKNDKVTDNKEDSAQGLYKKLTQIIPQSIEDICKGIAESPETPELVQMMTEGPTEIRELAPLFIIPGITGQEELEIMARSLLYPTFCAVLPSTSMSIQKLASTYAEQIRQIWPKGPYNIVGVSWGGLVAIEIARILEQLNVSLHLYLIDAAPQTLHSVIKHLGEESLIRDVALLSRIFNINDVKILKKIEEAPTWDEKVKAATATITGCNQDNVDLLNQGLLLLRQRLEDALQFKPTEKLVPGTTHLIRPGDSSKYDNCGLTLYFKQTPEVVLVPGDHLTIINNEATAEYINQTFQLI